MTNPGSGVLPESLELSRSWRRVHVVLLYATYLVGWAALSWKESIIAPTASILQSLVVHLAGGFTIVMLLMLFYLRIVAATRVVTAQRRSLLDEREAFVAAESFRPAFHLMALYIVVSVFALTVLRDTALLRDGHLYAVAQGAVLLYLTLPSSVVAWTEPDPPAEDEPVHARRRS